MNSQEHQVGDRSSDNEFFDMDDLDGEMQMGGGLEEVLWLSKMLLQVERYGTCRSRKRCKGTSRGVAATKEHGRRMAEEMIGFMTGTACDGERLAEKGAPQALLIAEGGDMPSAHHAALSVVGGGM